MRYECRITAYDILDQVTALARVWDSHESAIGDPESAYDVAISFEGEGISHPRDWLRDVLVALLEEL